ncbi:MAG: hypothetical protein Greene041614_214 [Parcubacteria group bacterium Greene0416_14]|nr:MAG: hypothetical protein Greene041614_214 [Parcubacteria group bacterium Greene0416_14]TSD01182.1 MAG: hypothetical protein Greene101415_377 [Parcubacteria group bacterium Greene1014_15]TSD08187.1 MAG: hypothetical protein Greene07144_318 [Parcubacteria group bacterium Greene0714_4]
MRLHTSVIARYSEAIQSVAAEFWIASEYLAMTDTTFPMRKMSYSGHGILLQLP